MSLLLERHAQIIMLCKEYILDNRELYTASESLYNLIEVVWKRVLALKAGFTCVSHFTFLVEQTSIIFCDNSQQRLDLDSAFEFFCNGLYGKVH